MVRKVIILVLVLLLFVIIPIIIFISWIKEHRDYVKQFKNLQIGDVYVANLTSYDDVFSEPKYTYVKIINKKEKDGIYYVQYMFLDTKIVRANRFNKFLSLYYKV